MPRNRKIGIQTLQLRVFLPVDALAALLGAIFVYNRINATILRQFDDRLIFLERIPWLDEHAQHVPGRDVFT